MNAAAALDHAGGAAAALDHVGGAAADALDHIGVVTRDGEALWAAFERLGFQLTPFSRHSGRETSDGPVELMGSGNRCAMLHEGYIELLAIVDPARPANGLDRLLDRHPGIHILALTVADEDAALARLRQAGIDIPGVLALERRVDAADPHSPIARFARLPLADAPEGRIQLIRHLTPELIWQQRWLRHPNRAVALDAALLAVDDPVVTAARLAQLAGRPAAPDPAGGLTLDLPQGRVRILSPETLATALPGLPVPALPFMAGVVVRTDDAAAAARNLSDLRPVPGGWMAVAGGAAVVFR